MTAWLMFVMFNCVFVTFSCGILGQVWYLIVLIPDICHLSYLKHIEGTEYTDEPRHVISNNVVCATSKASDQPVHTRNLIRALC